MNQAVFAFRRYEDASLSYTGIDSHEDLRHLGLYDTVVAKELQVEMDESFTVVVEEPGAAVRT